MSTAEAEHTFLTSNKIIFNESTLNYRLNAFAMICYDLVHEIDDSDTEFPEILISMKTVFLDSKITFILLLLLCLNM